MISTNRSSQWYGSIVFRAQIEMSEKAASHGRKRDADHQLQSSPILLPTPVSIFRITHVCMYVWKRWLPIMEIPGSQHSPRAQSLPMTCKRRCGDDYFTKPVYEWAETLQTKSYQWYPWWMCWGIWGIAFSWSLWLPFVTIEDWEVLISLSPLCSPVSPVVSSQFSQYPM